MTVIEQRVVIQLFIVILLTSLIITNPAVSVIFLWSLLIGLVLLQHIFEEDLKEEEE